MSFLRDSFLKVPLQNVISLYSNEIVPRMTKRNQVISITVAAAMSLAYFINDILFMPPKNLRHIPHIGYFSTIKSLITNESHWDRAHRVHLPLTNKGTSLFVELGVTGWELQVTNPVDAKRVLLKHDIFAKANFLETKGTLNFRFSGGPNILLANGSHWKTQRMILSPAFRRSLPVKLFGSLTQDMFKVMDNMNETVFISDLLERWTLDVIGKAGFGFDFNAITNHDNEWVKRYNAIQAGLRNILFFLYSKLDNDLIWMFPERQKVHKEMDLFLGMIDDVIRNKKLEIEKKSTHDEIEDNERDLLGMMMEGGENGEGVMSDAELKSNLCLLFAAGHDTTANSLAYVIHYLAENPDMQQKAREEVIKILGDAPMDVLPTIEDTKNMTYINMVIKETLRINGPAVRVLTRITNQDTELSGTFIPKGTQLTVNIFDIQHTEEYWKNASIFDPERFSDDGTNEGSSTWLPFGNGARMCIGMNFSMCEQRVILSMLLRKYNWSTPNDSIHKNGLITAGYGVVGPVDLDMKFERRY